MNLKTGKIRLTKKVICIILSQIIAFGTFVTMTFGSSLFQNWFGLQTMLTAYAEEFVDLEGAVALNEDAMRADDHTISFENQDGSNTVYIFTEPVSFTDENGNIVIKDVNVEKADNALRSAGYDYTNGQNDYRINFSEDKQKGIQIEYNDISFSIIPLSDTQAEGAESVAELCSESFEVFEYKNIYGNGTNLRYYPQLNGLKDEIVLNQNINKNTFSFELKTDNCTAVLNEDATVSIIDLNGNIAHTFAAPYAYDSSYVEGDENEHIADCTYSLSSNGNNSYILTINVSKTWLESENTVYPVIIDPITEHLSENRDASVRSSYPNDNFGNSQTNEFGKSAENGRGRVYTHFHIPDEIADYATINSAAQWERELTGRTTTMNVKGYLVNGTWEEDEIKWGDRPGYFSNISTPYKNINSDSTDKEGYPLWYRFDIKDILQAIVGVGDVNENNYGIVYIAKCDLEDNGYERWRSFASRSYASSSYRPYTVINYTNDTTAPTINTPTRSPSTWTNQNVVISIDDSSFSDSGSGKSAKPYAFSQSTDTSTYTWGAATTKTVTKNGTWYVGVRDRAHNIRRYSISQITNIDKLAPPAPTVTLSSSNWSQSKISITAVSDDASATTDYGKSGVKYYSCTKTEGRYDWKSVSNLNTSYTFNNIDYGTYYVYAKDQAGNISAKTVKNAKVDLQNPVVNSVEIVTASNGNTSSVHITASDNLSGIKAYSLNGGSSWVNLTNNDPGIMNLDTIVTTTLNADSIDVRVKDLSGRVSSGTVVELTAPKFYDYDGMVGIYNPNLNSAQIQYKIDDEDWEQYEGPFAPEEACTVYARYASNANVRVSKAYTPPAEAVGVYTDSATDLSITNNDLCFDITRDYSSDTNEWRFSTEASAEAINNGDIIKVNMPDDSNMYFVKTAQNTYVDEITGYSLNETTDSYSFNADGEVYSFSKLNGRLECIADLYSNQISFTYGTNNSLSAIVATADSSTHTYAVTESNGKIQSITTPVNEVLDYQYTNDGLVKVYYDKDTLQFGRTDDIIISEYTYSNGRIETTNGNTVHYDNDGHYVSLTTTWNETVENEDESEPTEPETPEEEPEAVELDFSSDYPVFYEGTETIHYDKSGYTLDGTAYITENEYNQSSQLITVTEQHIENYNNDNANVIYSKQTTYFDNSDTVHTETVIEKENDVTNTTVNTYNESSQLVSVVVTQTKTNDAGGTETVYTQNITYSYFEGTDTVHTETVSETENGNSTTTVTTYDTNSRVVSESTGGNTTSYTYDVWGNVLTQTNTKLENGVSVLVSGTAYVYDDLNRCIKETLSVPNETDAITLYAYNPLGEIIYEKSGNEVTRTLYDKYNRVMQEIEPQDYSANDDSLSINANDTVIGTDSYTDSNVGQRYVYNSTTRLLTSETNRLGVVTNYTYHTNSSVVATESFDIYVLSYNTDGKITSSTVNGNTYATYSYNNDGNPTEVVYGNGQSIQYVYDSNNNLWKQYHNNSTDPYIVYDYVPAPDNTPIDTGEQLELEENLEVTPNEDYVIKHKTNYDSNLYYTYYNSSKVEVAKANDTNTVIYSYKTTDAEDNSSTTVRGVIGIKEYSVVSSENGITNTYDGNSLSAESTVNNTAATTDVKVNSVTAFTVTETENETSDVKSYGSSLTFTDNYNNSDKLQISSSSDGTDTVSYQYYADGQLHTVTGNNYTASYTYDVRGNLTEKTVNNVTTDYTYTNDKLTAVGNAALTYDSIGNVLTYGNKSYTWSSGRNLAGITEGTDSYSYSYNKYGFRTSKTVNSVTTDFNVAEDGTVVSQSDGTYTLYFEYAEDGTPLGFVLNDTQYLYITNSSADVMAIADSTGTVIATYSYNEWGEVTVNASGNNLAIANINPLRYRGYYFDSETGYYYLQSRYYDPEICRFINADLPEYASEQKDETEGINIFVYCGNDAVNNNDPSGHKNKYKVLVVQYGRKPGSKNIFGHLDVSYSGKIRTYGPHPEMDSNFLIADRKLYLQRQKATGRKIYKFKIKLDKNEFKRFKSFYSSLVNNSEYKGDKYDSKYKYYKIIKGKYKKYKFLSVNCSTAVYDAFYKAIPLKINHVYSICPEMYGFLNTPQNIYQLIRDVKNYYAM